MSQVTYVVTCGTLLDKETFKCVVLTGVRVLSHDLGINFTAIVGATNASRKV